MFFSAKRPGHVWFSSPCGSRSSISDAVSQRVSRIVNGIAPRYLREYRLLVASFTSSNNSVHTAGNTVQWSTRPNTCWRPPPVVVLGVIATPRVVCSTDIGVFRPLLLTFSEFEMVNVVTKGTDTADSTIISTRVHHNFRDHGVKCWWNSTS